jgi:flagellar biosynthesis chaperone FliJ
MDKLNEVLKRLERQYKSYEKERNNEDEDGIIDVSLACNLADSIPYLIKTIEELQREISDYDENVSAFESLWLSEKDKREKYEKVLKGIADDYKNCKYQCELGYMDYYDGYDKTEKAKEALEE